VISDNKEHLDEQQLIQAVVDENDLPQPMQKHLASCDQCRLSKDGFEQDLARLGQIAARYAPQPRKKITLPVHEVRPNRWAWVNWRHAIGAVATVAVIVFVFWGSTTMWNPAGIKTAGTPAELSEARRFMTEVDMLVENALPPLYLEISAESKPNYDEAFYQFLIPQIDT
jgi:hypothetical protein